MLKETLCWGCADNCLAKRLLSRKKQPRLDFSRSCSAPADAASSPSPSSGTASPRRKPPKRSPLSANPNPFSSAADSPPRQADCDQLRRSPRFQRQNTSQTLGRPLLRADADSFELANQTIQHPDPSATPGTSHLTAKPAHTPVRRVQRAEAGRSEPGFRANTLGGRDVESPGDATCIASCTPDPCSKGGRSPLAACSGGGRLSEKYPREACDETCGTAEGNRAALGGKRSLDAISNGVGEEAPGCGKAGTEAERVMGGGASSRRAMERKQQKKGRYGRGGDDAVGIRTVVVGRKHVQPAVVVKGMCATLKHEPNNVKDENALLVVSATVRSPAGLQSFFPLTVRA